MTRCDVLGHKPVLTSVIPLDQRGNVWRQFTCSRCAAKRQDMTHPWGNSPPTQWWK